MNKKKACPPSPAASGTGRRVMVFGVFDRLHPGHHYFLESARKMGDELIVVVARDTSVALLKNKKTIQGQDERLEQIQNIGYIQHSIFGDEVLGSYGVIREHQPHLICIGYDQDLLEEDLKTRIEHGELAPIELVKMTAFEPEVYHSSLLS